MRLLCRPLLPDFAADANVSSITLSNTGLVRALARQALLLLLSPYLALCQSSTGCPAASLDVLCYVAQLMAHSCKSQACE